MVPVVRLDLPVWSNPVAFALTAIALAIMFSRSWSPLRPLGLCALLGIAIYDVQVL